MEQIPTQPFKKFEKLNESVSMLNMEDNYPQNFHDLSLFTILKRELHQRKHPKTLVEELETTACYEFAKNNFATMLYRCQNCLKRLHLIAVIVPTLGAGDNAHAHYQGDRVLGYCCCCQQLCRQRKINGNYMKTNESRE